MVVVDPPAFIKRKQGPARRDSAAYRKLNQLAMQLLERDGILVSCSCSYHLRAGRAAWRPSSAPRGTSIAFAQVVEVGGQAPDHPIHPAIPETRYLKALSCRVVHD